MLRAHSVGGLVFRKDQERVFWLVGKHSGYHKWIFPKGKVEAGESEVEAVKREISEETGVRAKLVKKNPVFEYDYYFTGWMDDRRAGRIHKTVTFYLLEYVSGDLSKHDFELSRVEWLSYHQALRRLAFPKEREALREAKRLVTA